MVYREPTDVCSYDVAVFILPIFLTALLPAIFSLYESSDVAIKGSTMIMTCVILPALETVTIVYSKCKRT